MPKHPEESRFHPASELVDAYLDGELDAANVADFEAHVATCAACAAELELARRVVSELRALPELAAPPAVTRAVHAHAESHPSLAERLAAWWRRPLLKPAVAMVAAAVLATIGWRLVAPEPVVVTPPEAAYSPAEIARAEAELKLALAYLGAISHKAGSTFGTEVGNRVVVPVSKDLAGAFLPRAEPAEPKTPDQGEKPRHATL